jgi:hypothetical protein
VFALSHRSTNPLCSADNLVSQIDYLDNKHSNRTFAIAAARIFDFQQDPQKTRFVEQSSEQAFALSGTIDMWRPRYLYHLEYMLASYLRNVAADYNTTLLLYDNNGTLTDLH